MPKYHVEVDETIQSTTTYEVRAKSAKAARAIIENGDWHKANIVSSNHYDGELNRIDSVTLVQNK